MQEEERTLKRNLKLSRQHVLYFVHEAGAAVPEETAPCSVQGYSITNALDGSEDGDLHGGLADVAANHFFATDSEESFDGFKSD